MIVNDDPQSGVNHETPGIAVAPNGRIDIAWYDYRFTPRAVGNTGLQDVFYASSSDGGKTFTKNVRITDRTLGVYGGAIGSGINVGITSTDDTVYFAWQDTRNARPSTQSEDIYSASFRVASPDPGKGTTSSGDGTNTWVVLLTGVALGAGVALGLVWLVTSGRSGPRPKTATA